MEGRIFRQRQVVNDVLNSVNEHCSDEERQQIVQGLVGYNSLHAPPENYRELSVLSRCADRLIGGLFGYTHWNWLFIKQLWVEETFQRHGIGSSLMRMAEQEALRRGCQHAHCDTFDFQALPFYQAHGYEIFGQLDEYPAGHSRYFLQKQNLNEIGNR